MLVNKEETCNYVTVSFWSQELRVHQQQFNSCSCGSKLLLRRTLEEYIIAIHSESTKQSKLACAIVYILNVRGSWCCWQYVSPMNQTKRTLHRSSLRRLRWVPCSQSSPNIWLASSTGHACMTFFKRNLDLGKVVSSLNSRDDDQDKSSYYTV